MRECCGTCKNIDNTIHNTTSQGVAEGYCNHFGDDVMDAHIEICFEWEATDSEEIEETEEEFKARIEFYENKGWI